MNQTDKIERETIDVVLESIVKQQLPLEEEIRQVEQIKTVFLRDFNYSQKGVRYFNAKYKKLRKNVILYGSIKELIF